MGPGGRNDDVINEKLAVTGSHSLDHSCKDRFTDVVGPVMHDRVHKVGSCSLDRLLGVEVIRKPFNGRIEILNICYNGREVLEVDFLLFRHL